MGRDFPPVQTGPGAHSASCTMGTGSFPGVKYGRGVLLTTHPLIVRRSWKSRAVPLTTLWATTGPVTGSLYLNLSIYKKSNKTDCTNYRGKSLLPTTCKILSNILLSRLTPYAVEIIGDHQCGFRRNRSTADRIFCIRQIL